MTDRWTSDRVPDQTGRTAVITGGNTGLGYATALVLARRGAHVVLACRDITRANAAADRIRAAAPGAEITTVQVDLAAQASIRSAAERIRAGHDHIDLWINNAGGVRRQRVVTGDGFEQTLATNHLGPFALTGLVLDRLTTTPGSRIVTVSSIAHRRGTIRFTDPHLESGYRNTIAYSQSKLANLMFTYALQRRLAGTPTIAVAAHPGNAHTEFGRDLPVLARAVLSPRLHLLTSWLLQSAAMGALPTLRAAVDPDVRGGEYYGPPGRAQFTGHPVRVDSSARSHDVAVQERLWAESERLTGVTYPVRGFSSSVHPDGPGSAR